jgi:hypothetical protein
MVLEAGKSKSMALALVRVLLSHPDMMEDITWGD